MHTHTSTALQLQLAHSLLNLLPAYIAHLTGKGHRPRGRAKYRDNIKLFVRWLDTRPGGATVERLQPLVIEDFRDYRATQVKPAVVFNELCTLRSFCRWAVRKGYIANDPTVHVDFPKVPAASPRALNAAQLDQLRTILATMPRHAGAARRWQRNRLALLLFLYTGMRLSELSGLRWGDVHLDAAQIVIRDSKGGKTRSIPLHGQLLDLLRAFGPMPDDAPVIVAQHGGPLTSKSLAHIFERWLAGQGLRISAHQLRHTFATRLLRNGATLADIQNLLGHESIETTAIYLTVESEHLRGAVERLPSLDRL